MRTLLLVAAVLLAKHAAATTPDQLISRALEHLDAERYALTRTYLEPILIDPRLSAIQRSKAFYLRGYTFYLEGLYRSAAQDFARALEFDPGNDSALNALAGLHIDGNGVPRDLEAAYRLNLRAARIGNPDAKAYVGYALLTGTGTAADLASARFWLKEAAEGGQLGAKLNLARSYRAPYADPPDLPTAVALYEQALAEGAQDALTALGYMQLEGELGQADPKLAADYFRRATEAGLASGMTALAHLYLAGEGVLQSDSQGFALLGRAVAADHTPAFAGLAYLYQTGTGVARNDAEAERLYTAGAERGDLLCQLRLAEFLYARSDELNVGAALRWFKAAAEQGDASARNAIAWILATSRFDALRDGERAIAEAEIAVASNRSANTLDTLAAAYAEAGRFDDAVDTQEQAVAALTDHERAADPEYAERLAQYQTGKAWRE